MSLQNTQQYLFAPHTARKASQLANAFGYRDLQSFVETLPPYARVMDVGSGLARLGMLVAISRPDIKWVNFDYLFFDDSTRSSLDAVAPPNVKHVPVDIAAPLAPEWTGLFDRGLSFWTLPHLSLEANQYPAYRAATAMLKLMKRSGQLTVGPDRGFLKTFGCCVDIDLAQLQSEKDFDQATVTMVSKTRRTSVGRAVQLYLNYWSASNGTIPGPAESSWTTQDTAGVIEWLKA